MTTEQRDFRARVKAILDSMDPDVLSYDQSEFWLIQQPYEYINFLAVEGQLLNTAIALPLSRGLHNGTHRKAYLSRDNVMYRYPYSIHCLNVCKMLADLHIPLPHDELDILLASSLCHDMIEDVPFKDHGKELYTTFHLDKRVYDTVKLVSKRRDFTEEEEIQFFHRMAENPLSLLVKLADRGNNVEDLFNMSTVSKIHEYIDETRRFFIPMADYGFDHYPRLGASIIVLIDKIKVLTNAAEVLVDRNESKRKSLEKEIETLRAENERLRQRFNELWEGNIDD